MNALDPKLPLFCHLPSNPVPEGGRGGYFRSGDGVRLRYGIFPRLAEPLRGTICLLQGRTEFIEKYFETIGDFQRRGFTVAAYDLRGQGGSDRLIGNRELGHVEHFEDYWADLAGFHRDILLPDCPPPFYLVGHSTGGLVALYAATRDRLMFERAFLSAPMIGLPGLPRRGAGRLANAARFLGLGHLPLQRRSDRVPTERDFEGNPLTSDRARYGRAVEILTARPDLRIGPPTIGWIAAALEAMVRANDDHFPQKLKIPVLMVAAACDSVVSTGAIERLALRMRLGHHLVIGGARHELLMETDAIRAQVLAAFDAFITNKS